MDTGFASRENLVWLLDIGYASNTNLIRRRLPANLDAIALGDILTAL